MQRQLPQADIAEQSVLASIFIDKNLMITAADMLEPSDFYNQNNALLFEAMLDLFQNEKEIDFVTVGEYFNQNPAKKRVPLDYISQLSVLSPSSDAFEESIDIVLDAALKRAIIRLAGNVQEEGFTKNISAGEYLDQTEKRIFDLAQRRRTSTFKSVREIAKEYQEITEINRSRGSSVTGLDTGYESLNRATSGFQPEELIIIAARPSMGKSAFAINLALNIAKPRKDSEQKHVALFSLEMSNDQIVGRMISNLSGIDGMRLRVGNLKNDEWNDLGVIVNALGSYAIHFDDSSSSTIAEIRAKCRKLKQEGKLDLILIDYLQLVTAKAQTRQEEVSQVSRQLKQLAKELRIPVIALSQLSRLVERRESNRPVLSDLRESGSIEQDADIVIFLHSEDYYNRGKSEPTGEMDVMIAKNRQGMTGTLKFRFLPSQSKFYALADREED